MSNYALDLYRENHDSGDKWGSVMGMLFPLAAILDHLGETPNEYRAPMVMRDDNPVEYGDDYLTTELWDDYNADRLSIDEIRDAFKILSRYRDWLEAAGLDY